MTLPDFGKQENRQGIIQIMPTTESLVSSGYLSASVNVGVAKLLRIAAEIGVTEKCEAFLAEAGPNVEKIVEVVNALKLKKGA